jgi:hypothetical protein
MIAFPANLDLGKTQGKLGIARLDSGRNGSPCGKLGDSSMEATTCGVEGLSVGKKLQASTFSFSLASDRASGRRFDERDFLGRAPCQAI